MLGFVCVGVVSIQQGCFLGDIDDFEGALAFHSMDGGFGMKFV